MRILAIETSCDETAISIIETPENGGEITVLSHIVASQIDIHREWGGVVPNLAKREHQKNLFPLLRQSLEEAGLLKDGSTQIDEGIAREWLKREPDLIEHVLNDLKKIAVPEIDAIAVTTGPGLEPALWVGINFAKVLSLAWQKTLIPTNHMEGHVLSGLLSGTEEKLTLETPLFPAVALLISGGHTEIVLMKEFGSYELVGKTRDDAVGEAFDKVARLLGLPYPGGPEISKLASKFKGDSTVELPRPMINSNDLDFSFSGLKTAVLYLTKNKELTDEEKIEIAYEFEQAATDVVEKKVRDAIEKYGAESLIVGGGVIANKVIRERLSQIEDAKLYLPDMNLTTDNATMIAVAGLNGKHVDPNIKDLEKVRADGNLAVHG